MLCKSLIDHQKDYSMPNKIQTFSKDTKDLSHCECTACNIIVEHHKKDIQSQFDCIYMETVEISK